MKKKLLLFASLLTIIVSLNAHAQWNQTSAPNVGDLKCFCANGTTLFAGTGFGGVLRSMDGGASWDTVNAGLTNSFADALATIGTNSSTGMIFCGTWGGVFRSIDNGASWNPFNVGLTNIHVQSLAVLGTNTSSSILFVGTDTSGVFRSTDSGVSWTNVSNGLSNLDIYTLAATGESLFAGTVGGSVFRSTDNGGSWLAVNNGMPSNAIVCELVVSDSNASPTTIFAVTSVGIFLSTNNGANWSASDSGLSGLFVETFAVAGAKLVAGTRGNGVFLSIDNGLSWSAVNAGLRDTMVTAVAGSGNYIFAGTDGAVWRRLLSDLNGGEAVTSVSQTNFSMSSYPNPFTSSVTINVTIPVSGLGEVRIVTLLGAQVAEVFSGELEAGNHSFLWDAHGFPAGLYECIVQIGGQVQRLSMLISR